MDEFNQLLAQTEKKPLQSVKASESGRLLLNKIGSRTERNLSSLPQYGAMIVKSNLEQQEHRKQSRKELA